MPCYVWEHFNDDGLAVVWADSEEEATCLLNRALDRDGYVSLNEGDGHPRQLGEREAVYVFGGS